METTKMSFFKRVKTAVLKFDEYEKFLIEDMKKAFGYFFKIIAVFALIFTIACIYKVNTESEKIVQILENEFPDFSISNNELQLKDTEKFEYYFDKLDFAVIIEDETIKTTDYQNCIYLLKDKIIIKYDEDLKEITYKNAQLNNATKQSIINTYKEQNKFIIYGMMSLTMFTLSFAIYTIIFLLDVVTLSIIGLIISSLIKTKFKFKHIFKISIYAMTLPIILYLLYAVANIVWGTTIKYFEIGYDAISYIYIITVLLMMKSDIIKNMQELQKVMNEQKKVREELQREKQEEKDKEEEANRGEKKKEPKKDKKEEEPKTEPQTEN